MKAFAMINTAFDFRTDAGERDPDTHSATLRRYHRLLWSKALPGGEAFNLDDTTPGEYLHHRSQLGEFFLASDSVIPTFRDWMRMQSIVTQLPEADKEAFETIRCTIGGMLLFPSNKIDGKLTINGARGLNPRIADRIDLTLECIRRHYRLEASPLGETLQRYRDFFSLFGDFPGYVEFFLLQDLVTDDAGRVKFSMHFDDFTTPAVPRDIETYKEYRRLTIEFVKARNGRIYQWVFEHQQQTPEHKGPPGLPSR
jgi:hypothetical protein